MKEKFNIYFIGDIKYEEFKSSTVLECYNYLKDEKEISLDIETTRKFGGEYEKEGLDPYLSSIVMVQLGTKNRQYIIDFRCTDISMLYPLLSSPSIIIIGQNLKFEYLHILHNCKTRLNKVYDTMIVEQILFNGYNLSNSLKELNKRYLGVEVDKTTALEFLEIKDKKFTVSQIKYGAEDILYPILVKEQQEIDIETKQLGKCVSLEMQFLLVLGEIEYKGIHFDKDIWKNTYKNNLIEKVNLEKELNKFVLDNYMDSNFIERQLDLFSNEIKCNIKWTSSKQVIEFFKFLDICPMEVSKTTKKLTYTVESKVLISSLNTKNKNIEEDKLVFLKKYIKFREKDQSCSTFGIDFFKHVNPITNRLHSNYRQILNTGRISSRNPNLQNIPATKEFRSAFNSPDNYKIVNADYSGQENICLVNTSLDPDLLEFYHKGFTDMHSFNARKIFKELEGLTLEEIKSNHSDKRQITKTVVFALAYGGNAYTISNNLGVSKEEGEKIYNSYFEAFPRLREFFDETIRISMKRGFIEIDPITKRKFYFKDFDKLKEFKNIGDWRSYYTLKGKYERACLNYIIQGAAGSITKFAAILFRRWILENNLQNYVSITNLVHDEINLEVHNSYTKLAAEYLEKCMEKAGGVWCTTIPLKADAVITTYWNH